ncbi:MAG TPA: GTP cyclohydrolase II RibA [Beijerinckiaceae bacterium]|jgi:GTP cyclohydrolase II
MMRLTLSLSEDRDEASVERAVAELRAARPVLIEREGERVLALSVEGLDAARCAALDGVALGQARLVLPAPRLRRLGLERAEAGAIALPRLDPTRIEALALRLEVRADAPVHALQPLDLDALELARLAQLLPALVLVPLAPSVTVEDSILAVRGVALAAYRTAQAQRLAIVSRAPVPLEGAPETEFVVFRGGEGLRDQVAVIVGRPDPTRPVPVRLHSACLTGDLFGSLKCDCGDQLRGTVRALAEAEGGIVLYLDQEGRGNGLANKIRAYKLQAQGFDTYEADAALGFPLDQRRFDFAGSMLRQLGVTQVKLLTNNPDKAAALRAAGLVVTAEERVLGRVTPDNVRYLAAKRDRTGHALPRDLGCAGE